jgi:glucosamine--fructose-6-phosphate aminotransferase (isomerizing)
MSLLQTEIESQPSILQRLLDLARPLAIEAAARMRAFDPHYVVIAARGSSDNAARYAQYLFGAVNRLPVALATPSLFTLYHQPPALRDALVIGISQSGQSPDIVAVLEEARRQHALTLAVTNDPASPLGQAAELVFPLFAGEERAIAATKTYTSQLLALAMLSTALHPSPERWSELQGIPTAVARAIEQSEPACAAAAAFQDEQRLVVIGRDFNYATAFEIALKLKELCALVAEPYSSADFRHGPIAMVEPGFPVVAIAVSGAVLDDIVSLLDDLERRRAALILISDRPELLARAQLPFQLPSGVPEWLSPIVGVIPGQLFARALARARGLDPDRPRGLQKVTRTR